MPVDLGHSMNDLEMRVHQLEQRSTKSILHTVDVYLDPDTGGTVVVDPLDWSVAANGWESYSSIAPLIIDPADPAYPGGELSTNYGTAACHLVGSIGVLSGMVRRTVGATPSPLVAGTRYDLPMFGLPLSWRPQHNVILPCLMGNADPDPDAVSPASAFGTAWIEIRPEIAPTLQSSGRVYFVTGTLACSPGTGWISLQGAFPCQLFSSDPGVIEAGG